MDGPTPSLVLAAYVESLLEGRRVAVFGDATAPLAEELVERGARVVHVYDPEVPRAAEAASANRAKQISILPLEEADIGVRDGTFDVAIIPDLPNAGRTDELLKQLRRSLSARGVAVIAAPNPDAKLRLLPRTHGAAPSLGYYDLYDAVAAHFPEVRMLGQTPFVGYAVIDFAPGDDPEVAFDTGLVDGGAEEPEWFIALASQRPADLEAFSVVQLSAAKVLGSRSDHGLEEELRAARAAKARLGERTAELEAENSALRERSRTPPDEDRQRSAELEAELERRAQTIRELEARALSSDGRVDEARDEIEALRGAALKAETAEADARALRIERDEFATRLAMREAELGRLTELAKAEGPDELAELEALLKERGDRMRSLEVDLREAERIGRELIREIAQMTALVQTPPAEPAPSAGEARLAEENARLSADLEALNWSVLELEGRLARASAGTGLAEELETARTELRHQAVLLAQLRATAER